MVFAVEKLCFSVRIILTHRKCEVYKAARTANYKPIGFTESAQTRECGRSKQEQTGVTPGIIRRILDEEAIYFSIRYRSDLCISGSLCMKRIACSEQPRDRSAWLFATRCWLVAASCSLLVGLAGCGPASSDNAPNLGPRASVGGPSLSKQGPSPGNDPFTPAANPLPLSSGNEPGAMSGKGTVPGGNNPHAVPVPSSEPAPPVDTLVVPAWMAKELDSPDVRVRLRALETWAQSAPLGAIDPLILALEDKDERVQDRAMELIEQDMARDSEAEK